jgi:hypothetical protein
MKLKLVALAFVASLTAAGTTATATAGPGWTTTWTYYSDATYTQEVGWRNFTCQGRTIKYGDTSTQFVVISDEQPC